jgi:protein TonB
VEVSDILRDRLRQPAGLERMAFISAAAHIAALLAFVFLPGGWFSRSAPDPRPVMNISLSGGNGGPNNGGLAAIGGRAVQTVQPEPPPRPEPVRAPAAKTPETTMPVPTKPPARVATTTAPVARPRPPAPKVEKAPDDARGRTPTKGAEVREGSALAETGARGQGFGLSTSSGAGTGSTLDIVGEFCCPDYLVLMTERIRTNWNQRAEVAGVVVVKYTIQRDGTVVDASVERSSGYVALDISSLRAVVGTGQLPPLPAAFPNPTLTVHLNFQYRR